jgi:nuclear pore complex protein Nup98-Nup96
MNSNISSTKTTNGTTTKFSALSGQDTVIINGSSKTFNTNHQCITAMKEYEFKSLEELRYEDYQAKLREAQKIIFGATNTTLSLNFFGPQAKAMNMVELEPKGNTTSTTSSPFSGFGDQTQSIVFGSKQNRSTGLSEFEQSTSKKFESTPFSIGDATQQRTLSFGQTKTHSFGNSNLSEVGIIATKSTQSPNVFESLATQLDKPAFEEIGSKTSLVNGEFGSIIKICNANQVSDIGCITNSTSALEEISLPEKGIKNNDSKKN